MSIKAKPKAKTIPKSTVNPLRADPSRTATLRRLFVREVDWRFNRLKKKINDLIIGEDAFGLTVNIFCPTGKGGGIDPTCGKHESIIGKTELDSLSTEIQSYVKSAIEEIGNKYGVKISSISTTQDTNQFLEIEAAHTLTFESKYRGKIDRDHHIVLSEKVWKTKESFSEHRKQLAPGFITDSSAKGILRHEVAHALEKDHPELRTTLERLYESYKGFPSLGTYSGYSYREMFAEALSHYESQGNLQGSGLESLEPIFKGLQVSNKMTANIGRFQFQSTTDQVINFLKWLQEQILIGILNGTENQPNDWWNEYIRQGYEKGAGRAFTDTKARRWGPHEGDFYLGTKDQFLRSSFARPVSFEKVRLLASRTFADLKGVTEQMAAGISRSLMDGLVQGMNPRDIARNLSKVVEDIGRRRAEVIARTEIIRAHAEGQLDALELLGVTEVGVMVEWKTAGDHRVCELCSSLENIVLKITEARGMIPRHPNAVFAGSGFVSYGECEELVRAWYCGPSVILTIGSRRDRTTIGPNHPIMTRRGMVPAAELCEGDEVLYDVRCNLHSTGSNIKEIPLIENVFESVLSVMGHSRIVPTPSNLHGDRVFCKGEVQAIHPTAGLLPVWDSFGVEKLRNGDFTRSNTKLEIRPGLRSIRSHTPRLLLASPGSMSSSNLLSSGDSSVDTHVDQPLLDDAAINSEMLRDEALRLASQIQISDCFQWKVVHNVSFGRYEGLAFDATTATSLYYSGGLVVSNCRCAYLPANVGEDQSDQIRTKGKIESAIDDSVSKEKRTTWMGADTIISKVRPESVLEEA